MVRKFDQPFVEVTFWLPFQWLAVWRVINDHPQFQVALRDALNQVVNEQKDQYPHG